MICIIFFLIIAVGCAPKKPADPINVPSEAIEIAMKEVASPELFDRGASIPRDWWTIFGDDQLSSLIVKALKQNPSLQGAHAQILLAFDQANFVRAALFPTLTWGADVSREKFSETGIIPFNTQNPPPQQQFGGPPNVAPGGAAGIPVYFTQYETEVSLLFDFDIWKKNRNTLWSALDQMQAKMADTLFAELELGIAVAKTYFSLQVLLKREEIAEAIVKNHSEFLEIVQKRVNQNLDNQLSVHQAEVQVASSKQGLQQVQGELAAMKHQLHALVADDFTSTIDQIALEERTLPIMPLPANIPVHLLSYRPDITAQLWLIESAGKEIDVARAGFYPDFNIAAFFGVQTITFSKLFQWRSTNFNVDPAVTLPIFDGGRLIANLKSSEVNYDLAILSYNQLVLDAVKEVLDGLSSLRYLDLQLQQATKTQVLNQQLFELTEQRVARYLNSRLDLLNYQNQFLLAQDREIVALGNKVLAILSLIKSLGGGYEACE